MINKYISEMVAQEDKSTAEHSENRRHPWKSFESQRIGASDIGRGSKASRCRKNQSGYQDSAKAGEADG